MNTSSCSRQKKHRFNRCELTSLQTLWWQIWSEQNLRTLEKHCIVIVCCFVSACSLSWWQKNRWVFLSNHGPDGSLSVNCGKTCCPSLSVFMFVFFSDSFDNGEYGKMTFWLVIKLKFKKKTASIQIRHDMTDMSIPHILGDPSATNTSLKTVLPSSFSEMFFGRTLDGK